MTGLDLRYAPPGPTVERFLSDDSLVRGLMGPIGGGKSTANVFDMIFRAQRQGRGLDGVRRTRWAVIRNTYRMLETTTILTWHQWVPKHLGEWSGTQPPTHKVKFKLADKSLAEMEVIFLALDKPDDVQKLLSMELTGAWINEARDVSETILADLKGRIGRYPAMRDGGPTWWGITLDTNPPDTDSWWYKLFEEERPENHAIFKQPSGRGPRAENLTNLRTTYYSDSMAGQSDAWIKVYIDGEYGYSRSGKPVYPEFRDSLHVAAAPLEPVQGLPLVLGADAGLTPAAILGQRMPNGQWRILDELVSDSAGAVRFGNALARLLADRYPGFPVTGWADPAAEARASTDESTWIEVITANSGVRFRPTETNAPLARQEAVRRPLATLIDGEPGLLLSPSCRILRKGFNDGYRLKRVAVAGGGSHYHDKPEKNEYSHPHDALQYLMLGGGEYAEVTRRKENRFAQRAQSASSKTNDWRFNPLRRNR